MTSSFNDRLTKKKKEKREPSAGQIERILLKGFTAHHGEMRLSIFWHIRRCASGPMWDSGTLCQNLADLLIQRLC